METSNGLHWTSRSIINVKLLGMCVISILFIYFYLVFLLIDDYCHLFVCKCIICKIQ